MMNGIIFSSVLIFCSFQHITCDQEDLRCYECNMNLTNGPTDNCNDPYKPKPSDLVACPTNESHHCHKGVVLFGNILATLRTCISSREINKYCNHEDSFPLANVECYFCKENACNAQESFTSSISDKWYLTLFVIVLLSQSINTHILQ